LSVFQPFSSCGDAVGVPDDDLRGPDADALARRDSLFQETSKERIERVALGAAWSVLPKRIDRLPRLARLVMEDLLTADATLPDPRRRRTCRNLSASLTISACRLCWRPIAAGFFRMVISGRRNGCHRPSVAFSSLKTFTCRSG